MENYFLKDVPIVAFIDDAPLRECVQQKTSVFGRRLALETIGKVLYGNAIYTERFILVIMTDMTAFEKSRSELAVVKEKTLLACHEVINKQMRVAQEIEQEAGEEWQGKPAWRAGWRGWCQERRPGYSRHQRAPR